MLVQKLSQTGVLDSRDSAGSQKAHTHIFYQHSPLFTRAWRALLVAKSKSRFTLLGGKKAILVVSNVGRPSVVISA